MQPLEPIDALRRACRSLLWRVGRTAAEVERLVDEVESLSAGGQPLTNACESVYARARGEVIAELAARRRLAERGWRTRSHWLELLEQGIARSPWAAGPDFQCDAALGGLTRWLRAAGYDALFWPNIDDDRLLEKLPDSPAILLTTDRLLYGRGVISAGAIAAMLVSIELKRDEQFVDVARRLGLKRRPPRCMACSGLLSAVDKHAVADRIPPRTFPWRDEYYECRRCGKLFWRGTHWQRIEGLLSALD